MNCYDGYYQTLKDLCSDGKNRNLDCLKKILHDNMNTAWGRKYGFEGITDLDGYRKAVPATDYSDHEDYALKEFEGEKGQLTAYDIYAFCKSSGSSGNPKILPVTGEALGKQVDLIPRLDREILKECGGKILRVSVCRTEPDTKVDDTLLISEILLRHACKSGTLDENCYIGGFGLLFNRNLTNFRFAKLWAALLSDEITIIESVFLYDTLRLFEYLQSFHETLLSDISKQNASLYLPPDVREYLFSLEVSESRIDFLREEFSKGFDGIAKRIWPNLKLCIGVSGRAYEAEENAVRKYLGNVPILYHAYCSSEAFMGYPLKTDDYGFVILPQNAFYEFIPVSEKDRDKIFTLDELTVGESYEMLLTTFSGLYRYRQGDVLKCVGYLEECPVVEFVTRKNQALSMAGEKVSMLQLEEVAKSFERFGIIIHEYSFFASTKHLPYRYMGVLGLDMAADGEAFEDLSEEVDTMLRKLNYDYDDLRSMGDLDKPLVIGVGRKKYRDYIQHLYYNKIQENKPVHVLNSLMFDRACEWVEHFIEEAESR